ncbi:MAG: hypothetical protein P1U32_01195 [Legionellaceae bacterium]|nr:hypothetical protein [Legionellaceae bacterium]
MPSVEVKVKVDISDTLAAINEINEKVDSLLVKMRFFKPKPSVPGPTVSPVRKSSSSDAGSPVSLQALFAYNQKKHRTHPFTPPHSPDKKEKSSPHYPRMIPTK